MTLTKYAFNHKSELDPKAHKTPYVNIGVVSNILEFREFKNVEINYMTLTAGAYLGGSLGHGRLLQKIFVFLP